MIAISPGASRLVRLLVRRSRRTTPPISVGVPRLRSSVGSRISASILPPLQRGLSRELRMGGSKCQVWDASSAAVRSEAVTETAYGLQRPYAERAVNLLPEVSDVHLDHIGAILVADVPSRVQQLVVTENLARAAHEGLEECELATG